MPNPFPSILRRKKGKKMFLLPISRWGGGWGRSLIAASLKRCILSLAGILYETVETTIKFISKLEDDLQVGAATILQDEIH